MILVGPKALRGFETRPVNYDGWLGGPEKNPAQPGFL